MGQIVANLHLLNELSKTTSISNPKQLRLICQILNYDAQLALLSVRDLTDHSKTLDINIDDIVRNADLSQLTVGNIVNVEVLFLGNQDNLSCLDLWECIDPASLINKPENLKLLEEITNLKSIG